MIREHKRTETTPQDGKVDAPAVSGSRQAVLRSVASIEGIDAQQAALRPAPIGLEGAPEGPLATDHFADAHTEGCAQPAPSAAPAQVVAPHLGAPLPALIADLRLRAARRDPAEAPHVRAVFAEVVNRMYAAYGNQLDIARGGIAAAQASLDTATLATPGVELQRKLRAKCQLRHLAQRLRTERLMLQAFGARAGEPAARLGRYASHLEERYRTSYNELVLQKPAHAIIDNKAIVGQLGREMEREIEQAAQEARGVAKRLAKPLFVAALKLKNIDEKLAELLFELSWDLISEVVGDQLILKGQVNWEEVSDKLVGEFVKHVADAVVGHVAGRLSDHVVGQLDAGEVAKAMAKVCVDLGIEVPFNTCMAVAEQLITGKSLTDALATVFNPSTLRDKLHNFVTGKNFSFWFKAAHGG